MKRQIRQNVFETNSSSMHSLVVMKRDEKYTPEEITEGIYLWRDKETGEENCVWNIWERDLEFGRSPFKVLATFKSKWLYAMASLVREYNDEKCKELFELAERYISGLKRVELPMDYGLCKDKEDEKYKDDEDAKTEEELIEFVKEKQEQWDIQLTYYNCRGWWRYDKPYTGYVDEDILSGFLEKENISIEEFLINKKYVVIVDGDEYCIWGNCKKSGLVNENIINYEYRNI